MSASPFRRRGALARREQSFPNLTPMVDVVMVILVFFMAATTFAGSEWFLRSTVARPAPAAQPAAEPPSAPTPTSETAVVPEKTQQNEDAFQLPPVKLFIDLSRSPEGETLAEGLGRPIAPLRDILAHLWAFTEGAAADKIILSIRAAPDVPWSDVVRVHEECAAAGITQVEISLP
jgi:biopolymer transport protein ExbD